MKTGVALPCWGLQCNWPMAEVPTLRGGVGSRQPSSKRSLCASPLSPQTEAEASSDEASTDRAEPSEDKLSHAGQDVNEKAAQLACRDWSHRRECHWFLLLSMLEKSDSRFYTDRFGIYLSHEASAFVGSWPGITWPTS
ncbi:unnamed protein product [Durusdinium trenchii]|uniref:Uncharacterized protein n=1 Tax=Durusdinium trenchii TaxID=1381693 RepID=A0ABP0QV24_9DINO